MESINKKLDMLTCEVLSLKMLLDEQIKHKEPSPTPKYLSLEKLIQYLESTKGIKVSKSTIYKMTSTSGIPSHKAGNKLVFMKCEIDAWIDNRLEQKESNKSINNTLVKSAQKKIK